VGRIGRIAALPVGCTVVVPLKRYYLRTTFFDIGEYAEARLHLVRETMLYGNEVQDHAWIHRSFTGATDHTAPLTTAEIAAALTRTRTPITTLTGHPPRFFRFPVTSSTCAGITMDSE